MAGVGQRLEIRQGQSLVMTPQLQQAIKLLQLSNIELAEYCEQELERNPLLERDEREQASEAEREAPEAAPSSDNEGLDVALAREDFSKSEDLDASGEDKYNGAEMQAAPLADWTTVKGAQRFEGDEDSLESALASGGSLKDHLEEQLAIAALPPEKRLICLALIDAVDEAGYLRADLDEIAERLGASRACVDAVLKVLLGFDPIGVGARDLAECLAIQLKAQDRLDPAMAALLTRLDLVARRETAALCALCGVDGEDVADMIAETRGLAPSPGLAFGTEPVQPVIPDVFVKEGPDGA